MSNGFLDSLAGIMIKPAIRRFVTDNPNVAMTFRYEGDNVRVKIFKLEQLTHHKPAPIADLSFTPEQQYAACVEFMALMKEKKR